MVSVISTDLQKSVYPAFPLELRQVDRYHFIRYSWKSNTYRKMPICLSSRSQDGPLILRIR